ncbi:hypothetical protein [Gordonia sp. OPL2]|uniref:hypothetical protein n=1 Tax=Gordonia sp. OPL2 TaxID=2486274 RepID=UPI0016554AB3|nr:hypothetical protein [Gordonia sp. OPL2]ROZ98980.1 hypothetical protein EEB19_13885 [Gordonia sp. OPL2]
MSIRTRLAVPAAVLAAAAGMAVGGVAVNAPSSAAVQSYRLDVNDCGQPYTQLCKRVPTVNTNTQQGRIVVEFTADRNHCSKIRAQIMFDGRVWGEKTLSAGQRDGSYYIPTSPGVHRVGVRAIGVPGGCNRGYLQAWGGNLRIETDRDAANGIG